VFHGSKHAWKRLRWLCDVREIVNRDELDWEHILVRARQMGITHMLEQALVLLDMLFQIKPPLPLKTKNEAAATRLALMCLPFINNCDEQDGLPGHPLYLHEKSYFMIWHRSLQGKIRFLAEHYFPNMLDFEAVKFQDRYFFMYYLVRPFYKIKRIINKSS